MHINYAFRKLLSLNNGIQRGNGIIEQGCSLTKRIVQEANVSNAYSDASAVNDGETKLELGRGSDPFLT